MTAGDKGAAIEVDVSSLGYTIPAGSTCAMLLAPGTPVKTALARAFMPVTISSNGTTATYVTTSSSDVPSGGDWNAAVQVNDPSGNIYTTPFGSFYVNPQLPLAPISGSASSSQGGATTSGSGTVT